MKRIFLFLFILSLCAANAMAWPWEKKQSPTKPTPVLVTEVKKPATISDAKDVVKQLNNELANAKQQNGVLKENLARALTRAELAESETMKVQQSAKKLEDWGVVQQAEKVKWMQKYENAVKRYHRLKAIAAFIAAGIGILLGLQFMNLVPPPYNLGVPIGGALLFSSLVWFFL
jgi:uncharacterized transporter YbjL